MRGTTEQAGPEVRSQLIPQAASDKEQEGITNQGSTSNPRTGGIGIEHLWLMLPICLIVYKGFLFPLPPLDFWWHLKMGEVIATTRSLPQTDLFSFTATGRPFVLQNWLGELIYYWTYRAGGFPLLVFLGTAITLAGFLLMYHLCLDAARNVRIAACIGFLAALGNYGFLRPQTYSFLLFAVFYWVLARYREGRQDRLWLLPVSMALWVNLHGAFVLGLGLIGLYIAGESWRRFVDPSRNDALSIPQIRKLILILLLCVAATLLSPQGIHIFEYVRTVLNDPGSQQFVAEWRPPRVNDFLGFLLFYVPFLLGVVVFLNARKRPDFTESLLFLVFAIFGLTAIRNAAWFSTISYPLLARYVPLVDFPWAAFRRYELFRRLTAEDSSAKGAGRSYKRLNAALFVAAVLALVVQSPWIHPKVAGKSLLAEQIPVGAVDYMERHQINGRLFHPQEFGDYLMWRLWPRQQTFVDGRVHVFPFDFLSEYERAIDDPLSTRILDKWDIQYVLLHKRDQPESHVAVESFENSRVWAKMYEDELSVLFRKSPKQENN